MKQPQTDYDGVWKEALEIYFEQFMLFFFPKAHAQIDWSLGYEFLDKELQQVTRDAAIGNQRVDKLVKVWLPDGQEAWVLVHVEVQTQKDAGFAERMYVYNYRLYDHFHRNVASMAILGDEIGTWKPTEFSYDLFGCRIKFEYPVVKLNEFRKQWDELEASTNPFATVVMAHLKTQDTRRDDEERKAWKLSLTRRLYKQGYSRKEIIQLYRFIDWLMRLPDALEELCWQEIQEIEQEQDMAYVTTAERIGIRKGYEQGFLEGKKVWLEQGIEQGIEQGKKLSEKQGLLDAIELGIELKFGAEAASVIDELETLDDSAILKKVRDSLKEAKTIDEVRALYRDALPAENGEESIEAEGAELSAKTDTDSSE